MIRGNFVENVGRNLFVGLNNKTKAKKVNDKPNSPTSKSMEYTEDFIKFWKLFPGRFHEAGRPKVGSGYEHYWKIGKRKAMEEWRKLTEHQKKWAMYSVGFMRKGKYVPDAFRWLRDGKYEDIDLPVERESYPANVVPIMKGVPQGDTRSTSDKVNEQQQKLKEKCE